MNSLSKLVPASIKAQCNAGIEQLSADNTALDIANQSIEAFINDSSIESVSFNSMKHQLSDYKAVIYLLKLANDYDIMDYRWLYNLVGSDVLSGSVVDIKSITESNLKIAYENIDIYEQKAKNAETIYQRSSGIDSVHKQLAEDYREQVNAYRNEVETYEKTIKYCQSVIEQYDSIETNTKNLFTESVRLRQIAKEALMDMQTTFRNDMYVPHQNASWRSDYKHYQKAGQFKDTLKTQFGFDDKTVRVLWNIYDAIQIKYADLSQKERDWYFTRSISQMAGYNNKPINLIGDGVQIETHAWRNGAGWVYEYEVENEEAFFCNDLGIPKEDYEYMRQMVRLQHLMVSDPESYDVEGAKNKRNDEREEFETWKEKMTTATNIQYSDEEYLSYYTILYNSMGDKGDFSHMLYTISASLIDEGKKVDNQWSNNTGSGDMSWNNKEERVDITGWLGDAIYSGENDKVSFANDDFIADLDADNIIHRMSNGKDVIENMTQYYQDLSNGNADEFRTKEFLSNNTYNSVETTIFDRINAKDENNDGVKNILDIKESDTYADTYEFLTRLKQYQE